MKKSDSELKRDIESELDWEPRVNAAEVGVTVDNGSVRLLGTVDTYPQKRAAEDAARRVSGVQALKVELDVKVLPEHDRSDSDITAACISSLTWDIVVPTSVEVKVIDGTVTLTGEVSWNFQRHAAENAVRFLPGVVDVLDVITLKPQTSAAQLKDKVQAALKRRAKSDTASIQIETSGSKVTLSGSASSWQSIHDASEAAWAAPGVTDVVDNVKLHLSS